MDDRELFSVLAHEFRNPLVIITELTKLMLRRSRMSRAEKQRALEAIDRQAHRLSSLIEILLDTSRAFEARPDATADVALVVDGVTEWVRDSNPERDVPIMVSIPDGVTAAMDPMALDLIVMNLVGNAVKFALDGTPVSVTARSSANRVRLSVTNIAPAPPSAEERAKMFRPFVQLHDGDAAGGVGLGLHIVKRFTEVYGGAATVDSTDNAVTVTVDLPLAGSVGSPVVDLTDTDADLTP